MSKIIFTGMAAKKWIRDFRIFEYVNNGVDVVVGLLILCKSTGRVFLIQRNDKNKYWSILTGGYDPNNDINYLDCIKREMEEELRFRDIKSISIQNGGDEFIQSKNRNFKYYYGVVEKEFSVILDDENLNWGWFSPNGESMINGHINTFGLPDNLYPGVIQKIQTIINIY
jgi:8-oxo-dGTP pyrophosphatase MutT (NUDIX family)